MAVLKEAAALMYSAARELNPQTGEGVVLRPSKAGTCPSRLWHEKQAYERGEVPAAWADRNIWAALQGQYNEQLIRTMLRVAGARVMEPPEIPHGDVSAGFDTPNIDGLVYWPQMFDGWAVLELKYVRAYGQIGLAMNGLAGDRGYFYQGAAYVNLAQKAIKHYSKWEKDHGQFPVWQTLSAQMHYTGQWPEQVLFCSVAKDPSTTNMLFSSQIRIAKYEEKAQMTPTEAMKVLEKDEKRVRWSELGEQMDFYFELLHKDEFAEPWRDIQQLPALMGMKVAPQPLWDPTAADDDLHFDCRECPGLAACRERELTT